jgi:hypothetical protein
MSGTPAPSIVTVVVDVEGPTRLDVTLVSGEEQGRRPHAVSVEYSPLAAPDEVAPLSSHMGDASGKLG